MRGGQQPEESPPARFLRRVLSGPVDRPDGFWSSLYLGETNETLLRSSRNTAEIGTTYTRSFNQWSSEMSASNREDAINGTLVPGLVDRSTGHPEFVLERSRIHSQWDSGVAV